MLQISDDAYRLLKKLYEVDSIEESELFQFVGHTDRNRLEPLSHFLLQQKFIKTNDVKVVPDGEGGKAEYKRIYKIDLPGKAYVEEKAALVHDKRVENIKYIITTVIAVAAFIKSFFFPG